MASVQKSHEERARSAAEKAAEELAAARQGHHAAAPVSPRGGGGILGTVQESARSVMGAVRGTFSGGGDTATAPAEEEAKGKAAADKAWGTMDAARGAAEHARDYAAEKKEGARLALAGDAVGRKGETNESAWQQGQDVRRRAAEKAAEEERGAAREPSEAEKGRSATEDIYGKARGALGAFGEKMVMPTDVVAQKRAEAAGAGGGGTAPPTGTATKDAAADKARSVRDAAEGAKAYAAEPEEDVMLRVKAADQMTGQAFSDVGMMGEEGTGASSTLRSNSLEEAAASVAFSCNPSSTLAKLSTRRYFYK